MIDLHYWPTPNGHKIAIFLEEAELPYRIVPVHIGQCEQFAETFLTIAPNNRIPAIVDHAPDDGGEPLSVFESGAILLYLSGKCDKFLPAKPRQYYDVLQWLMWQMGGFGPMLGQNHHFRIYAPEQVPYAIERYEQETQRLYAVLNRRLAQRDFICDTYSIADMACYPWAVPHERQGIDFADYPHVGRWVAAMAARPAVVRAYEKGAEISSTPVVDDEARKILFGQTDTAKPSAQ